MYLGVSGYINLLRLEGNNLSTMSILSQKSSDCFSSLLLLLSCSLASASLFIYFITHLLQQDQGNGARYRVQGKGTWIA